MGKKENKNKESVHIVLWQTVKEMLTTIKYGVIEELDKIATVIQISTPVAIACMGLNLIGMLLVSTVIIVCVKYVKEVGYRLNHMTERGFPVPLQRYTQKDEHGFIWIKEEEEQEAMLYLCDVEDYLKKKGLL